MAFCAGEGGCDGWVRVEGGIWGLFVLTLLDILSL